MRKVRLRAGAAERVFLRDELGWRPAEGFRRSEPAGEGGPSFRGLALPKDQLRRMRYFVGRSLTFVEDLLSGTGPMAMLGSKDDLPPEADLGAPRGSIEVWDDGRKAWWRLELGAAARSRDGLYFHLPDEDRCGLVHRALFDVVEKMAHGRFDPRPGQAESVPHQP